MGPQRQDVCRIGWDFPFALLSLLLTCSIRGVAVVHGTVIMHGNKLLPPKSRPFCHNTDKAKKARWFIVA